MNPGPVEEAGQTSREVVHALAGSPVILFLLIFIIIFLGLFFYAARDTRQQFTRDLAATREHYDAIYKTLFENQATLLKQCGGHT